MPEGLLLFSRIESIYYESGREDGGRKGENVKVKGGVSECKRERDRWRKKVSKREKKTEGKKREEKVGETEGE